MTYIVAQCSTCDWSLSEDFPGISDVYLGGRVGSISRPPGPSNIDISEFLLGCFLDARKKVNDFQVRLDDFGLSKITVKDNGDGVASSLVPAMVQPHTTSKISEV